MSTKQTEAEEMYNNWHPQRCVSVMLEKKVLTEEQRGALIERIKKTPQPITTADILAVLSAAAGIGMKFLVVGLALVLFSGCGTHENVVEATGQTGLLVAHGLKNLRAVRENERERYVREARAAEALAFEAMVRSSTDDQGKVLWTDVVRWLKMREAKLAEIETASRDNDANWEAAESEIIDALQVNEVLLTWMKRSGLSSEDKDRIFALILSLGQTFAAKMGR